MKRIRGRCLDGVPMVLRKAITRMKGLPILVISAGASGVVGGLVWNPDISKKKRSSY